MPFRYFCRYPFWRKRACLKGHSNFRTYHFACQWLIMHFKTSKNVDQWVHFQLSFSVWHFLISWEHNDRISHTCANCKFLFNIIGVEIWAAYLKSLKFIFIFLLHLCCFRWFKTFFVIFFKFKANNDYSYCHQCFPCVTVACIQVLHTRCYLN